MNNYDYEIPNDDDVSPEDIQPDASLVGADLSDARLTGADLSNADIKTANLKKANLVRADLSGANLARSKLVETDLPEANLTDANLHRANLTKASLKNADLLGANIRNANLKEADLQKTDFANANLRTANLSESSVQNANLSGANLFAANLSEANLKNAEFAITDQHDKSSESASFESHQSSIDGDSRDTQSSELNKLSDVNPATLVEADLRKADLENAYLGFVDLREANLNRTDCEKAQFNDAKLIQATLENSELTSTDFSQAYLYQARLNGARINDKTKFHPAGDIGDPSTPNACRYDSANSPATAAESIENKAATGTKKDANEIRARRARSTYSRLEDLARENGFPDLRSKMFIRRQDARRELLIIQRQLLKGGFAQLQKWLFVYGESFRRILSVSAVTAILFWGLFITTGTVETRDGVTITGESAVTDPQLIWETLYHSLSVFFAGVGPLSPINTLGQVLTISLRSTGPVLLALLIFVLGRRAAR